MADRADAGRLPGDDRASIRAAVCSMGCAHRSGVHAANCGGPSGDSRHWPRRWPTRLPRRHRQGSGQGRRDDLQPPAGLDHRARVVTAVGTGVEEFRAGLRRATSPIRTVDRFDPSAFRSHVAARVDDFDAAAHMDARSVRGTDRFSQFGVAAGRLAMVDAGLTPGPAGHPDLSGSGSSSAVRWAGWSSPRSSTNGTCSEASRRSLRRSPRRCSEGRRRPTSVSRSAFAGQSVHRKLMRVGSRRPGRSHGCHPGRRGRRGYRWRESNVHCRRCPSVPST